MIMTKNVSSYFFSLALPSFPSFSRSDKLQSVLPSSFSSSFSLPLFLYVLSPELDELIDTAAWERKLVTRKSFFNDELIWKHPGRFALWFPYIISSFCFLGNQLAYTKLFLTSSYSQTSFPFRYFFLTWIVTSCRFQVFSCFFLFLFFFLITFFSPFLPLACGRKPPKMRANKF